MFQHPDPIPVDAITGLLSAFTTYPIVAVGEAHWLQQEADFIARLLQHPDFPRTVQVIVAEFGNAYYQTVIDQYVAGKSVPDAELRRVWRNVGGPGHVFESPIYAQFFHNVRILNRTLPIEQQVRVLLGDPPVDETDQHDPTVWSELNARDAHFSAIVEQHILAQQQRALLLAGSGHFARITEFRPAEGNVVQRLEQQYPGTLFVVIPHAIFEETLALRRGEVRALEMRLAAWPVPALANVRGTWLGELDGYLHFDNIAKIIEPSGHTRVVRVPYIRSDGTPITQVRLREMVDALLYLGPQHTLTFTPPPMFSGPTHDPNSHV